MLEQPEVWKLLLLACLGCLSFDALLSRSLWLGRIFRMIWTGLLALVGVQLVSKTGQVADPETLWLGAGIGFLVLRVLRKIWGGPSVAERWRWFGLGLGILVLAPVQHAIGLPLGHFGAGALAALWMVLGLDIGIGRLVQKLLHESRIADLLWAGLAWLKVIEDSVGMSSGVTGGVAGWTVLTPFYFAIGIWGLGLGDWIREPWQSRFQRAWGVSLLFLLFGDLALKVSQSQALVVAEVFQGLLWIWAAWATWIARFWKAQRRLPSESVLSFAQVSVVLGTVWWMLEAAQQIVLRGSFDWSESSLFFLMSLWLTMVAQRVWNVSNPFSAVSVSRAK